MIKISKFIQAKILHIDSGKIDQERTDIAKKIKLFAKSNGSFNDSLVSACYYAKKQSKKMYMYYGNSYGHAVWRVTWKESDALNPINNTGDNLFIVQPDLTIVHHYIVERKK